MEEIRDKEAKFKAVKQKLQLMSKQRRFLEQEVNLLVQGSTNSENRAKSVPKKGQNLGSYTERVEKQMDLSMRAEKKPSAMKSGGEKRILATECREPDIKCRPDCTKHQKRYRFNVETASFTEIELFDDVISFITLRFKSLDKIDQIPLGRHHSLQEVFLHTITQTTGVRPEKPIDPP